MEDEGKLNSNYVSVFVKNLNGEISTELFSTRPLRRRNPAPPQILANRHRNFRRRMEKLGKYQWLRICFYLSSLASLSGEVPRRNSRTTEKSWPPYPRVRSWE